MNPTHKHKLSPLHTAKSGFQTYSSKVLCGRFNRFEKWFLLNSTLTVEVDLVLNPISITQDFYNT